MKYPLFEPLPRRSKNILLRRLVPSDIHQFQIYRTNPEVGRYQGWSVMSPADAQVFLSEMAVVALFQLDQWFQIAIADSETDCLIGDIGICIRSGHERFAEIGFTLNPSWQRQGLGTEAVSEALTMLFELGQLECVIAITDTRNLSTIRLLRRVGMHLKETAESAFRGEHCTEHTFEVRRRRASEADL